LKKFQTMQKIWLYVLILLTAGCSNDKSQVSGTWQLVNSESCDKNFLGLTFYVYPYVMYGHKIYITDSLLYNPHLIKEGLPFEKPYRLYGNQMILEGLGSIKFTRLDSALVLEKEGCKLLFVKQAVEETLAQKGLSEINFYVKDDEGSLVDSIGLQRTREKSHIFRIAESIRIKDLDKTFDEGVSDSYEYGIVLRLATGKSYQVVSFGKYETPFEIKTLVKYLLKEI